MFQKETMNIQKIHNRGTEINKINFYDLEEFLEEKGIYDKAFENLLNEKNDFVYISNGFLYSLRSTEDVQPNEWHHYFKKDESGFFEAFKLMFD